MNSTYKVSLVSAVKIELTRLQRQKSVRISEVQKDFSVLFLKQLFLTSTFTEFANSTHCSLTSACVAPDVLFVVAVVHHRLVLVIVLPEKMGQTHWFRDDAMGKRVGVQRGLVQRGAWAQLWATLCERKSLKKRDVGDKNSQMFGIFVKAQSQIKSQFLLHPLVNK